ncbi:MAG: hypothetical protein ABIG60_00560 [Patescibacteria group bacterium]
MKKVLTITITIIITLMVLFMILLSWVLIKNPLNVRGILLYKIGWTDELVQLVPVNKEAGISGASKDDAAPADTSAPAASALPMTPDQRQAVLDFGINPDSVIITPAMEECFIEKLGNERVEEIKNGDVPGALEMFKAVSCL